MDDGVSVGDASPRHGVQGQKPKDAAWGRPAREGSGANARSVQQEAFRVSPREVAACDVERPDRGTNRGIAAHTWLNSPSGGHGKTRRLVNGPLKIAQRGRPLWRLDYFSINPT